jgi:ribosomal protein L6P/L9E
MVTGVSSGYAKVLEINGVDIVEVNAQKLVLYMGWPIQW